MKKTKKFILGILVSVMILSTGIVAYANTSEHICSYVWVEKRDMGTVVTGTHTYVVKVVDGKEITDTCTVRVHKFIDVYKCGCGSIDNRPYGIVIHSSCGQ